MPRGKIRIKTLVKFLGLCDLTIERNRILGVDEVIQEIHCCRSNAYNYYRALKVLFPEGPLDLDRLVEGAQECLM
jgi:hypothetical protein